MVTISYEVHGDRQVVRRLERFKDNGRDLRPAFRRMAEDFLKIERRQFDSQGATGSKGWAPLKPATIRAKRNHKPPYDPRIMHRTRQLRNSLTRKGSKNHVQRLTSDEFFVGTSVPYAGPHQNPKAGNPLPRRRIVELTEAERRSWVKMVQAHLVKR